MAFDYNLPRPLTEDESRRLAGGQHVWGHSGGYPICLRCGVFEDGNSGTLCWFVAADGGVIRDGRADTAQRSGTRPRTVEVGMVLCRPVNGCGASAWRVESVRAGVSAMLVDYEGVGFRASVAIAAILHESGGWVLAEDWTKPEAE